MSRNNSPARRKAPPRAGRQLRPPQRGHRLCMWEPARHDMARLLGPAG